MQEMGYPF